jgi:serine/threonine protein kinase
MIDAGNYVNKSIGNYRIIALIGSGGFGSVYRGEHQILKDRLVAIKILHNYLSSQEEFNRFLQEAQILEHMQHPHILQIFDAGIEASLPYFVTEYAPHGSLRNLLKRYAHTPLPTEMALSILSQVGGALYYAHQQHIVHRDLKPENILFNASDEALLADFGIASTLTTSSVKYSAVIGTPSYMAPEQFQGTVSQEGDQYALGCIAYELFTGHAPFTAPDFFAMGFKHLTDRPVDPTQLNPTLPKHIEQAVLKAMAKQRGDRHPDVRAFIVALHGAGSSASWSDASSTAANTTATAPTYPMQGSGSSAGWSDTASTVANTNGTAPTYRAADYRAFPASTYLSEAPTVMRVNTTGNDQQYISQNLHATELAPFSGRNRQGGNTSQVPPTTQGMWIGETPRPAPKRPWQRGITLVITSTVVTVTILASLFFVFFLKPASPSAPVVITRPSATAQSTSTIAVKSTTATATHPANKPTPTAALNPTPTVALNPTSTPVATPRPTNTPVPPPTVTPTPTSTPCPPASETLPPLLFTSANQQGIGETTQNSYCGTVSIAINGVGQASGTNWSDAFYIYSPPYSSSRLLGTLHQWCDC